LAFGDAWLALAVALALLTAGVTATTIGLLFPWVLAYAGKDPAFGSGPVATIIQDVLSLLIYFILVRFLV
jgi:magnesium transporter